MVRLISFGDKNFRRSLKQLKKTAGKFGVDELTFHSDKQFSRTSFFAEHYEITRNARGAGYWLWKPYYILENLNQMGDGDILVYMDAGVSIISDIRPLCSLAMQSEIILFENYQGSDYIRYTSLPFSYYNFYTEINKNKYWCKRDVFIAMGIDNESAWDSPNVDASCMIFKVCKKSIDFVESWLSFCISPGLITDQPNIYAKDNHPEMIKHVHDQSILSVLAFKNGIQLYRSASQFGNHFKFPKYRIKEEFILLPYAQEPKANSPYGTIFKHHRVRDVPFSIRFKEYLRNELRIFDEIYLDGFIKSMLRSK